MERRNLLSWGGAILTTVAAICGGLLGCGGSADPRANTIVGAPGQTGTGGAPPTSGTGGAAASDPTAAPGSTIFAESYGDEGEQGRAGIAVDAEGNVYVAGNEEPVSTAPAGTAGPLPTEGTTKGVFLLQYSPTGELMWRQLHAPTRTPARFPRPGEIGAPSRRFRNLRRQRAELTRRRRPTLGRRSIGLTPKSKPAQTTA